LELINGADTAWILMSAALVMLMTPALGLFYGGLVRQKNALSTITHSFFILALISVQWVLWGYTLAFGPDLQGIIGGLDWAGLRDVGIEANPTYAATIPHLAFMAFQMMFAAITPALISGAFAERKRFTAFALFSLLWATLVYDPVAHWVWGDGGWLRRLGALDFAGGTVVHISSGVSWLLASWLWHQRPSALGAAAGALSGLVGITPAAGFVTPMAALLIGFCAGLGCFLVVEFVVRGRVDDSLDVFGVHGVGGTIGMLAVGIFASRQVNPAGADGLLNGNPSLLAAQALTFVAVAAYAGVVTWGLLRLVDRVVGLRVTPEEEVRGLDLSQHGELAYKAPGS
jgi:ammonium transporter, Amt family